jgi:type III restriction enzyme
VLLSQYKRKLFSSIHQDIKPVMMLKSKTIADNKKFYDEFVRTIKQLSVEDIERIADNAKGDMKDVFSYIAEKGIELENLLLEIKDDFKEENLLLVDGNNISPEKQLKLNSLEAKDNEFRVVFAVDMLNEGWDVLNLFDIVRLYETRDSGHGKVGKTTMQEAQLIGRGARYMPFAEPTGELKTGERKFDNDATNRLRALETLHYHSVSNPKYLTELKQAMVQTGIVAEHVKTVELKLKESFKKTAVDSAFSTEIYRAAHDDGIGIAQLFENRGDSVIDRTFSVTCTALEFAGKTTAAT